MYSRRPFLIWKTRVQTGFKRKLRPKAVSDVEKELVKKRKKKPAGLEATETKVLSMAATKMSHAERGTARDYNASVL